MGRQSTKTREQTQAYNREWKRKHADRVQAYQAKYRARHRERARIAAREWYYANKGRVRTGEKGTANQLRVDTAAWIKKRLNEADTVEMCRLLQAFADRLTDLSRKSPIKI